MTLTVLGSITVLAEVDAPNSHLFLPDCAIKMGSHTFHPESEWGPPSPPSCPSKFSVGN